MQALEMSLDECQKQLAAVERRAAGAEVREERLQKELSTVRKRLAAQHKVQSENDRLHSVVRELRRAGSTSSGITGGGELSNGGSAGDEEKEGRLVSRLLKEKGIVGMEKCVLGEYYHILWVRY